jgi:transmembrane sensor
MSDDQFRDMIAAEAAERVLAESEQGGEGDPLSWFRRSPVHIAEYLGMAKLSADLAQLAKEIDDPVEKLVAEMRDDSNIVDMPARDLRGPAVGARGVPRPRLVHAALGVAIAAIVVAGVGLISNNPSPDQALRYTTGHGEERTIRLADGTFVHLNTDSALDVKFGREVRLVELERGEAYFEVAKAPSRPFRVGVGAAELQDVGTAFDVFREDGGSVVSVVEGRVGVFATAPGSTSSTLSTRLAELSAGEQARVSASGAITARTTVDLNRILAWTRQQIVFDRESIGDVVAEFNRYNDVPIAVRDRRIAAIAISGEFRARDEHAFVSFLGKLPSVRIDESDGMIVVSAKRK